MNLKLFKAMRTKKKRPVDPNAPPRPNLMTHDVKIKDLQNIINSLQGEIYHLKDTVRSLQSKLNYQTAYLQTLHSKIKK